MSVVAWSEKLSVGIPEVDTEHQNLVNVLNQLDEAMKTGKGTRMMNEILTKHILVDDMAFGKYYAGVTV